MAKATTKRQELTGKPFRPMDESKISVDGLFPPRPDRHVTTSKTPAKGAVKEQQLERDVHALVARHGTAAVLAAFRAVERESAARTTEEPTSALELPQLTDAEVRKLSRRAKWSDRENKREHVVEFLRRVYGDLIAKGLQMEHIKVADSGLYQYLHNWLQDNELPSNLPLPSRRDRTDALIKQLNLPEVLSAEEARALQAHALRALRKFGLHR